MIIALYSPRPQSGKSTTKEVIVEVAQDMDGPICESFAFASSLKRLVEALIAELRPDIPYAEVKDFTEGTRKMEVVAYGLTARDLMVTVGTKLGRENIDRDVWVDAMRSRIKAFFATTHINPDDIVIVDDMRFPNEYRAMKDMGAIMVRIERPIGSENSNACEGLLEGPEYSWDYAIFNDGTRIQFKDAAREVACQILGL